MEGLIGQADSRDLRQLKTRGWSDWRGSTPLLLFPAAVLLLTPAEWPRWSFMWLLAFALFVGCKWLSWARAPERRVAPLWQKVGYLLAWPGLDARAFLRPRRPRTEDRLLPWEWIRATVSTLLGVALFWGVSRTVPVNQELLKGWVGMAGSILILHFGLFHLLSCGWRLLGIEARPLMNSPLASASLSEFWGRRWNTAFRDLTNRFLFRPLTRRIGPRWAVLTGFILSGLIHDLVISVPAGGGYGWPTLFFVVQGFALLVERSGAGRALGLGHGWCGWLFTMLVLGPVAFWLFHPPFVKSVFVPFMGALGAG